MEGTDIGERIVRASEIIQEDEEENDEVEDVKMICFDQYGNRRGCGEIMKMSVKWIVNIFRFIGDVLINFMGFDKPKYQWIADMAEEEKEIRLAATLERNRLHALRLRKKVGEQPQPS